MRELTRSATELNRSRGSAPLESTHARMQHFVLDVEVELFTLRERFEGNEPRFLNDES
jgi:hypothetical protein